MAQTLISILSLYTEGDGIEDIDFSAAYDFNPLPLYRGRLCTTSKALDIIFISILSLYTEGDLAAGYYAYANFISILSLYTEGDAKLHNILHLSCHIYVQLC